MPVAFMMGVPYDDSFIVAELIGTKLFLNEFVAYEKLSELKDNRVNGLEEIIGGEKQWISVSRCPELEFEYCPCGCAASVNCTHTHKKRKKNNFTQCKLI